MATPTGALGFDIGGTKIAAGWLILPEGRGRAGRRCPTRPERGGEAVLDDVERLARELKATAVAEGIRIGALGVGVCEIVDVEGTIRSANCLAWEGIDPGARLGRIAPCTVEADVRAAALAEARLGAGRRYRSFVYVTVGTGISSCLVVEGRPWAGARGGAGTLASGPLPGIGSGMGAGPGGSLESYASGPALVRAYREAGGGAESAADVLAAAAHGDPRAVAVVREAVRLLGACLGWMVNVLDPGAVVLGGGLGLGLAGDRSFEVLRAAAREHIWWDGHREVPIVPAELGAEAGWMGAAVAAWERTAGRLDA